MQSYTEIITAVQCFQQLVDRRYCVLSLAKHFTYWDNKFSSTSDVKTCRKKERTTTVTAELNIKISKMSELFSVRSFQYFISSFFFVVFRFSTRTVFILIRHFLPVILVRNKITRSGSLCMYKYNYGITSPFWLF